MESKLTVTATIELCPLTKVKVSKHMLHAVSAMGDSGEGMETALGFGTSLVENMEREENSDKLDAALER